MADDQVNGTPPEPDPIPPSASTSQPVPSTSQPVPSTAQPDPSTAQPDLVKTPPPAAVDDERSTQQRTRLDDGEPLAPAPTFRDRVDQWMKRGIAVLITGVVAVVLYFVLAAFLPRWWANQIGSLVGGSFTRGIGTGLTIGILCTLVPLLLVGFAFLSRGHLRNIPAGLLCVGGLIVAIPNLLTLSVVLGNGNASHAGQRILDVDGPGFRAASLWGAIIGAVVAALVGWFVWGYRRRGKRVKEYRAIEKGATEKSR